MSILNEFNKTKPAPAPTTSRQVYGSFAPLEDPRNGPIAAPTRPALAAPPVVRTQTKPALASTGGSVRPAPAAPAPAPAPIRAPAAPPVVRTNTRSTLTARDIDQRGRKPLPGASGRANPLAGAGAGMQSKLAGAAAGMKSLAGAGGRANPLAGAGAGMKSKLAGAAAGMKSKMTGSRMPTLGPRKPGSR